jgi:RNA polymerase sigma-70 factor (ECF subfamily)
MNLSEEFVMQLTQCQTRLYGFLFKRLADSEQAREVLQQTNLVLCRKAADFRSGTNFFAWAVTVARYQCMSYRTKQARNRLVFTDQVGLLIDQEEEEASPFITQCLVHLRHCMQALSQDNRELLENRYDAGRSIEQISAALDRSVGSIKVKLHRLRRSLMNCIQGRLKEEGT